jgi:TonB family protein
LFEFSTPTGSIPQSPRSLATSVVAHILVCTLLFTLRFSDAVSSFSAHPHVTVIAPMAETPLAQKRMQVPRPRQFHPPTPAHLEIPSTPVISAPAYEAPKVVVVPEIPRVAPVIAPPIQASGFTEVLSPAPVAQPKLVVKTAGFNIESSVPGPARRILSTVGSFDSANAVGREVAHPSATTRPGGFSDTSASSPREAQRGPVRSGAFGDSTVDRNAAAPRKSSAAAQSTPVEIVSKPKPAYTSEARLKKIEGEVLLEMQFSASGEARVLRLVRGLGYGLDENAVAAALGIRFHPATRDGAAVDSAALVHIVFQLAN